MSKRKLDIEDFQTVYVPEDIKKDIKFWKVIDLKVILICFAVLVISTFIGIFLRIQTDIGYFKLVLIFLLPTTVVFIVLQWDLPGRIVKNLEYKRVTNSVSTLADLSDIKSIEGPYVTYGDDSMAVFIEFVSGLPWDTATFEAKYERALMYIFMVRTVVKPSIEIDLYSITAKEEAPLFLQRKRFLSKCKTEEIRRMAEGRIRHHAQIENKTARKTSYCIRLRVYDIYRGQKEKLTEASRKAIKLLSKSGAKATFIAGDAIEDYIEYQLTPMAPLLRGKAEDYENLENVPEGVGKEVNILIRLMSYIQSVIKKGKNKKDVDGVGEFDKVQGHTVKLLTKSRRPLKITHGGNIEE